jgi:predicted Zn-ribbon and HTH transcriptional regulator
MIRGSKEDIGPVRTIRQRIIDFLSNEEMTPRELSKALGIREKEVYEHLSHIARSLAAQGKKLNVQPYGCLGCGYVFQDRKRFTRPSRCPRCKLSHIQEATYRIR